MRSLLAVIVTVLALFVAPSARADLKVVATTTDLGAVAAEIGGARVTVTAMALPTQDPHFVDARPHLALALSEADMLLVTGLDLEVGWLPTLQTGARNGAVQRGGRGYVDCSRFARLLGAATGRVDRSQGDVHPGGNPHYMLDPRQAARVARGIAAKMTELDPDGAAHYRAGLSRFVRRLAAAVRRWEARLSHLRGQPMISYHKSFPYLASWLGLRVVAHVEPRPGIPPNPAHVARALATARREGVRLVLQEVFYPMGASNLLAERAGAALVRLPGGPDVRRGQTYVQYIETIVDRLEQAAPR